MYQPKKFVQKHELWNLKQSFDFNAKLVVPAAISISVELFACKNETNPKSSEISFFKACRAGASALALLSQDGLCLLAICWPVHSTPAKFCPFGRKEGANTPVSVCIIFSSLLT